MVSKCSDIRSATVSDLQDICVVELASFAADAYPSYLLERLILDGDSDFLVLNDIKGKVAGYCVSRIERGKSHLISIAVLPNYRRMGIACMMVTELINRIRQRDVTELVLEVRVSNSAAFQLYNKLGFKEDCVINGYYSDGSSAIRMRKFL